MSNSSSGLQYDELGFLIGLKQTGRDVAKIDKNVEQIISLLEQALNAKAIQYQQASQPKLSALAQALQDAQRQPVSVESLMKEQRQATTAMNQVLETVEDIVAQAAKPVDRKTKPKLPAIQKEPIVIDSQESIARELGSDRQRDSNGRFIGSGQQSGTALGKITQTIGTAIANGLNSSPQGVDPTIDAINEVASVLSPVKRAAGFMLRPLSGLMKSRKRSEPLPKEESEHNKKQIKMLQRIADNLSSKGGLLGGIGKLLGAGGSLLGGLLGKGGKGLGKILKFGKGIPVLGALLTALSFSDWKSQSTKEKGGTVGSLAGGTIGAVAGSFLGPAGTLIGGMAGAWVGEKLGSTVAPYFKEWTDRLKSADLPGLLKSGWDSFIDLAKKAFDITPVGQSANLIKGGYDWIKQKLFGNSGGTSLLFRKQYGGQGLDAPAQYGGASLNSFSASEYAPILDEIARGESTKGAFGTSGYDAVYSGAPIRPPKPISQMTFGEVKAYQKQLIKAGSKSTGAGRYQNIWNNGAFEKMASQAGFKDSDIYNAENQDKLAIHYAGGKKQLDEWIRTGNAAALANKTSQQWAGVKNARGVGNYDGDGLNKARHGGIDAMRKASEEILNNRKQSASSKSPVNNQAASIVNSAKNNTALLSAKTAITPTIARTGSLGASFTPPKINTHVEPAREYLTTPSPQQVVVVNQNGGIINQNVSDRLMAHAITGGLGMGDMWNG
jgi:muramidase (phage lysozyme)